MSDTVTRNQFSTTPDVETIPSIAVIVGPTASGKSELAVLLAERFSGEVVNADSMQIYSGMTIGTAGPSDGMLMRAPHHLFGIIPPCNSFTAADFRSQARSVITDICSRGKLPIVTGGTGLYIRALLCGLAETPAPDASYRQELLDYIEVAGLQSLHERLRLIDAAAADRLHPNDSFRVIRALEVYRQTGRAFSDLHSDHRFAESWCRPIKIGIEVERSELYARIESRVDLMMAAGFLDEVRTLLQTGYSADLKSMGAIGYRELADHCAGKLTLAEAVELIKRNSRRYAKRQLTWFRKDPEIRWCSFPADFDTIAEELTNFLGNRPA